jgi:RNA polymerase sigma-70 factor (ECF subfamily)
MSEPIAIDRARQAAEEAAEAERRADQERVAELVRAARDGDREAFAGLYDRFCRPVHAVILARVPASEASDLVQDVFVLALRRLSSLRQDGAFGGWLMMIARNRATDYHRRKKPTSELPEEVEGKRARPTAEVKQVLAAIRELPETYRETLLMRLVEGMTGPEIAQRTGLKPESVRVNLHRGMKLLRKKLGVEKPR